MSTLRGVIVTLGSQIRKWETTCKSATDNEYYIWLWSSCTAARWWNCWCVFGSWLKHLHFLFSTEPEPQPNVQRAEQVKIIPAPGEFWNTLMESSLQCCGTALFCFTKVKTLIRPWCDWQCRRATSQIENILPSSFLRKKIYIQGKMIWIKPHKPPHVGHTSRQPVAISARYIACYIIKFQQTILALQDSKIFVFNRKSHPPHPLPQMLLHDC